MGGSLWVSDVAAILFPAALAQGTSASDPCLCLSEFLDIDFVLYEKINGLIIKNLIDAAVVITPTLIKGELRQARGRGLGEGPSFTGAASRAASPASPARRWSCLGAGSLSKVSGQAEWL